MTHSVPAPSRPTSQISTSSSLPVNFAFAKFQRLLDAGDFSAVFNDAPLRVSDAHFLILARTNTHNHARLGLVIAKKHVKRAVARNLLKRVLRESFRSQQHKLPPIDAIVLARRGADTLTAIDARTAVDHLWQRLCKRYQKVVSE